jgi:2',3'-cyclic-nucleotide 2'-phosphodiesterase (5'-nucleotidase family)
LLLLLFAALCAVPAGTETTLTIYYTASLNGNLDGCTCEMNPVAGLVKRAAFLRTLKSSGTTLVLDAGDIFDEYPDPDLAKHILEVYRELNRSGKPRDGAYTVKEAQKVKDNLKWVYGLFPKL